MRRLGVNRFRSFGLTKVNRSRCTSLAGTLKSQKRPEGVLPNVILRIAAQHFSAADAFAPESEVRVLIEPTASAVDAAHKLHAAALLRHKSSEDALADRRAVGYATISGCASAGSSVADWFSGFHAVAGARGTPAGWCTYY
jgi:hypothetical protein